MESSESSSEASCVSLPNARAAIWSIDTPARMSAPAVFFGCTPVRNAPAARAWSPAPSPGRASPCLLASPLSTVRRLRYGSNDSMTGFSANPPPVSSGVHWSITMPLGTYTVPRRLTGAAADSRVGVNAGTIPSSRGRASVAPTPRRNVRRGKWVLVMIHCSRAFLIWNGVLSTMPRISDDQR